MDKHYTIADVANAYNLHPETVRDYCRDGKIEFSRVGRCFRFTDEQLKAWENSRSSAAVRIRALERVEKKYKRKH